MTKRRKDARRARQRRKQRKAKKADIRKRRRNTKKLIKIISRDINTSIENQLTDLEPGELEEVLNKGGSRRSIAKLKKRIAAQ